MVGGPPGWLTQFRAGTGCALMVASMLTVGGRATPAGWNCSVPAGTVVVATASWARLRCEVVPRNSSWWCYEADAPRGRYSYCHGLISECERSRAEWMTGGGGMPTACHTQTDAYCFTVMQFGDGYAEKNPQLVGAFLQACSTDYLAAINEAYVSTHLDRLSRAVQGMK